MKVSCICAVLSCVIVRLQTLTKKIDFSTQLVQSSFPQRRLTMEQSETQQQRYGERSRFISTLVQQILTDKDSLFYKRALLSENQEYPHWRDGSMFYLHTPEAYEDLEVTINKEEMQQKATDCGLFFLRQPSKDKLIIGDGNLTPNDRKVHYIDYYAGSGHIYRSEHRHEDADTIDPDILRNPTIVSDILLSNPQQLLRKMELLKIHDVEEYVERMKQCLPQKRYFQITIEGIGIWSSDLSIYDPKNPDDAFMHVNKQIICNMAIDGVMVRTDYGVSGPQC